MSEDHRMTTEELIAAHLFDNYREGFSEEDAIESAREIMALVESRYTISEI